MQKRILVTGANGLLGQKLCGLLNEFAHNDIRFMATAHTPNGNQVQLDITNQTQVNTVLSEFNPTHIINAAAYTQVDLAEDEQEKCYAVNVTGVQNLVDAIEQHKLNSKLIHISTDFIFDGKRGGYVETDTPNPVNYYGASKLEGETVIKNSSIDYAILRTMLLYGVVPDKSKSNIVLWLYDKLSNGESVKLVNDQIRNPTLAEDLAQACWLVIEHDATGIFHTAGKECMSIYEMGVKIAEFFDFDKNLIQPCITSDFQTKAERPLDTHFSNEKANEAFQYSPRSFKRCLELIQQQLL